MTERLGERDPKDLKKDLHLFVETIHEMGREFGLNPHLEYWPIENVQAEYHPIIAAISESNFMARLKKLVGAGNIARIFTAPPNLREGGIDYLFAHRSPLSTDVFKRISGFRDKVEAETGVRISLSPADILK